MQLKISSKNWEVKNERWKLSCKNWAAKIEPRKTLLMDDLVEWPLQISITNSIRCNLISENYLWFYSIMINRANAGLESSAWDWAYTYAEFVTLNAKIGWAKSIDR